MMTDDSAPETVTILHLSDIHRTRDEPVTNKDITFALIADLHRQQREHNLPKPDILVVSGDLTQKAEPDEYEEAYDLLDSLKGELKQPDFSRIVLVPGNHDINWRISQTLFTSSPARPGPPDPLRLHRANGNFQWTDEMAYGRRLDPFRKFYERIYGRSYGTGRREQHDLWHYPDLGLCFVGLNSCDLVDHRHKKGTICHEALDAAVERLRNEIPHSGRDYLKIAVWHHDLNWRGRAHQKDSLDPGILSRLFDAGLDLGLVGHAHRTDFNRYYYLGYALPIVAAGSLCAGPRQRDESIPRLYNLISIRGNFARVYTRSRETKDTPWHAYGQWGTQALPYFDVPLRPDPGGAALLFNRSAQVISEWKTLHHHLHKVKTAVAPLVAELGAILDSKPPWRLATVRYHMGFCAAAIANLQEFARGIRYIGAPFRRQSDNDFVRARRTVDLGTLVRLRDRAVAELGDRNVADLHDVVQDLYQAADLYLNIADEELKERIERLCASEYWPLDKGGDL